MNTVNYFTSPSIIPSGNAFTTLTRAITAIYDNDYGITFSAWTNEARFIAGGITSSIQPIRYEPTDPSRPTFTAAPNAVVNPVPWLSVRMPHGARQTIFYTAIANGDNAFQNYFHSRVDIAATHIEPDFFPPQILALQRYKVPGTPDTDTIIITYHRKARVGFTGYTSGNIYTEILERRENSDPVTPSWSAWASVSTTVNNATVEQTLQYTDETLDIAKQYQYRIRTSTNFNGSSGKTAFTETAVIDALFGAPYGLEVSAVATGILLKWRAGGGSQEGYSVERDAGAGYAEVLDVTTAEVIDTTVDEDTEYAYKVRAYTDSKTTFSDFSNEATITTKPTAPSDVVATLVSSVAPWQVTVQWDDDSSTETSYRIDRSTDDGVTWAFVGRAEADAESFTDPNVPANTSIKYRVRASGPGGNSAYAESTAINIPPNVPNNLTVTAIDDRTLRLAWLLAPGMVTHIFRSAGYAWSVIDQVAAGVNTYDDAGLPNDTIYSYRLQYSNANDVFSPLGNVVSASTGPAAATGLVAASTSGGILITWTDNALSETSYYVERSLDGETFTLLAIIDEDADRYFDPVGEGVFHYRVRCRNSAGVYSRYSNSAFASGPLPAPTNLSVDRLTSTSVRLTWQSTSSTAEGYIIERLDEGAASYVEIDTTTDLTYDDTGLADDETYLYRVRAYLGSTVSLPTSAEESGPLLYQPSGLTVTQGSGSSATLNWTDNAAGENQGYEVWRNVAGGGWERIAWIGTPSANSYTVTGLVFNALHGFRVRAAGVEGYSPFENDFDGTGWAGAWITIAPPPLAFTDFSADDDGEGWESDLENWTL